MNEIWTNLYMCFLPKLGALSRPDAETSADQVCDARRIMAEHQLDHGMIKDAEVILGQRVKRWKKDLAWNVARVFGCHALLGPESGRFKVVRFVGRGKAPDVAQRAFKACLSWCEHGRTKANLRNEGTRAQCMRMSQLYSERWVERFAEGIDFAELPPTDQPDKVVTTQCYYQVDWDVLGPEPPKPMTNEELADWLGRVANETEIAFLKQQGA